ncbi:MAG: DoxX family protein [Symploca sp. SIO3C6]|uniref:DoxX family protein n=1 Tax=Symploca sp. SIO1C4 TaxID=2607765 RepID=A0A6B3N3P6_9CYAN|nr:DoxX family protein [Symploca sp. SIO3C6]NER26197.1 DoxX family protein [Symploca sp. SIO1C4]NET05898.1 DoxX family protein [Symploca sp. SIO2B6]
MNSTLSNQKFQFYSLLLLRIMLVAIFLYHGLPKAIFWSAASEKFVGFGLPGFLGPITGIAEVIASVLLIFGLYWQAANLLLLFIIAGAIVTVQLPAFLADAKKVAGLERDLLIMVGHITLLAFNPKVNRVRVTQE